MTGQTKPAKRPVVNTMDLTLGQLDEAAQLVSEGQCGYLTSITFVGLRDLHGRKDLTVEAAKALTMRDVEVIDNGELEQAGKADPTT